MRSPTKQEITATRRTNDRASGTTRAARGTRERGERREDATPKGGVVTSMVDALEDILKWERASERAMRVATDPSTTELDPSN